MAKQKTFITGGAGFIGHNLTGYLIERNHFVTVYDDLSNGSLKYLDAFEGNPNFNLIVGNVQNDSLLQKSLNGHDCVFHLASNADIAAAQIDPDIDFYNGTLLTRCVLEGMRRTGVNRIVFTSGSGVYGEVPDYPVDENFSPLIPVSTYGAQKLSSESLISAYSFMFDMRCRVFRFANVVGPKQTHGVAYDFIKRLSDDPSGLKILGDGTQTKPYIHVSDVIDALVNYGAFGDSGPAFDVFNVATNDSVSVNEIADVICNAMGLDGIEYHYTGGSRGWKADVPKYSLDTSKIKKLGWETSMNSMDAVRVSVNSMINDFKSGSIK